MRRAPNHFFSPLHGNACLLQVHLLVLLVGLLMASLLLTASVWMKYRKHIQTYLALHAQDHKKQH